MSKLCDMCIEYSSDTVETVLLLFFVYRLLLCAWSCTNTCIHSDFDLTLFSLTNDHVNYSVRSIQKQLFVFRSRYITTSFVYATVKSEGCSIETLNIKFMKKVIISIISFHVDALFHYDCIPQFQHRQICG